jgi:hypothetical protein
LNSKGQGEFCQWFYVIRIKYKVYPQTTGFNFTMMIKDVIIERNNLNLLLGGNDEEISSFGAPPWSCAHYDHAPVRRRRQRFRLIRQLNRQFSR